MAKKEKRSVDASRKVQPTSLRQTHMRTSADSSQPKKSVSEKNRVSADKVEKAKAKSDKAKAKQAAKEQKIQQSELRRQAVAARKAAAVDRKSAGGAESGLERTSARNSGSVRGGSPVRNSSRDSNRNANGMNSGRMDSGRNQAGRMDSGRSPVGRSSSGRMNSGRVAPGRVMPSSNPSGRNSNRMPANRNDIGNAIHEPFNSTSTLEYPKRRGNQSRIMNSSQGLTPSPAAQYADFADNGIDWQFDQQTDQQPDQQTDQQADAQTEGEQKGLKKTLSQKLAAMKHARNKERASKKFDRQFKATAGGLADNPGPQGDAAGAGAEAEGAPRAAVYKMTMGQKQKKSQKLQGVNIKGIAVNTGSKFSRMVHSRRFIVTAGISACLVALCLFLYPAAQNYYKSIRENARLEAEYAAVLEANGKLQNQIDYLQSDAGVEHEARDQFGWVKPGEHSVQVYGLETNINDDSNVVSAVVASRVKAPETWYSPILDVLFGVE